MISGRPSMYPIIGGHEGSGVVDAVGEGVTSVSWRSRGDVVHSLVREVRILRLRETVHLRHGRWHARRSDDLGRHVAPPLGDTNLNRMCNLGTFADYVVAHEASVIRIEPWYDLRAAALLSCGISTGFGAAVNRGEVKRATSSRSLAVVVSAGRNPRAVHAGARAVIAIDTNQSKIDRALRLAPRTVHDDAGARSRSCPT